MSRGFWAAIGAIAGFFLGGFLRAALDMARLHNGDGAGDMGAMEEIVGLWVGLRSPGFSQAEETAPKLSLSPRAAKP
jgi:hypothetical protein